MVYLVTLEYNYLTEDKDVFTVDANSREEAIIKAKNELEKNVNEVDYQKLVDSFVVDVEDYVVEYYLIEITLSNNQIISFPLRLNGKQIEEKINKRVQKQLVLYNKLYNANEKVINVNKRLLKEGEYNLYDLSVE